MNKMNGTFNLDGLFLVLLAMSLVGVELAVNKWIRKVTNTYWFWLGIALFYLIYCISVCWWRYWYIISTSFIPYGTPLIKDDSITVSHAFLLNICPFINFALCATLIADPTRKAARSIAPYAVFSSFFVIFFEILTNDKSSFTWQYIFIGMNEHPDLHYFGHVMNLLIGLGIIMNTPKLGWKGTVGTYGYILGFYVYVLIVAYATGAQYYVSGVNLKDFSEQGNFNFFNKIFPNLPQVSALVFFVGMIGCMLGVNVLCDTCKRGYFAYGDKYSGCWWQWYDYETTTIKEPWGWFSHQWQLKHPKKNIKLKLNKK